MKSSRSPKKNIVVTSRDFIIEYDFEKSIIRRSTKKEINETPTRNINLRFYGDTIQTHSKQLANRLLECIYKNKTYCETVNYGHGIEKIYEVNVPSPFIYKNNHST